MFGRFLTQHFTRVCFTVIGVKILFAWLFPVTADEAYFWQWGRYLDSVYYDHPFITGLWVNLGLALGSHIFWPRLLAILSQLLVFALVVRVTQRWTQESLKAKACGLLFLLSPAHMLFFLVTTDTPLFLFSALAALSFGYGFRNQKTLGFLSAGIFLGLALLSKYLVIFIALAMGVCVLLAKPGRRVPFYLAALATGFLPFFILNFELAREACWWPLQFNVFNRAEGARAELGNFSAFLFQQLFLMGPWVAWALFKERAALVQQFSRERHPYLLLFTLGLAVLGILSWYDTGLHWGLSLYPLLYFSIWILPLQRLYSLVTYSFSLVTAVLLLITALVLGAPYFYVGERYYGDYVMGVHGDKIHQQLEQIANSLPHPVLGTLGYTTAALMEYHSHHHYLVFKTIDTNGRGDDLWTDFTELDGHDFVLISTYAYLPEEITEYAGYFESVEYQTLEVEKASFYIAIGRGFKFEAYRQGYLSWANDRFFRINPKLPEGQCFFKKRYQFNQ